MHGSNWSIMFLTGAAGSQRNVNKNKKTIGCIHLKFGADKYGIITIASLAVCEHYYNTITAHSNVTRLVRISSNQMCSLCVMMEKKNINKQQQHTHESTFGIVLKYFRDAQPQK